MSASDLFQQLEQVIPTAYAFCEAVDRITEFADVRGMEVCWRGQADHRWGLTSSLVRQISFHIAPNDRIIETIEEKTHKEAASWIKGYPGGAGQELDVRMLTYLQHHGIPTRLIDFTRDPLIALFFASEAPEDVDGRVFAVLVPKMSMRTKIPKISDLKALKKMDLLMWEPSNGAAGFPRIRAQKGILAIGKLPTSSPKQAIDDDVLKEKRNLLAEEIREILSVPVKFCRSTEEITTEFARRGYRSNHPAFGLTFRIHIHKRALRNRLSGKGRGIRIRGLQKGGLSHSILYPDADGMVRHSELLDQLRRGVILP